MDAQLKEQGWVTRPMVGFNDLIGPIWDRREGERWVNAFRVLDKHLNFRRNVHGGMMATFADTVLGRVAMSAIKPRHCATVQLNMHYIAPIMLDDFVEGRGELVRVTRSMVFLAGRFTVGSRVVAMADGVWKILSDSKREQVQ